MRRWSWVVFFLFCNIVGVEVFKAAMTLPFEDALLPAVLSVPLIGLTALGASRVVGTFTDRDK
ncbi:MAG: hypothetical protein HYU51_06775 [Candidatus Rokubacteria bacterium]|nr:hypothetical protein [Candidatus Rokubacteria bacterium]